MVVSSGMSTADICRVWSLFQNYCGCSNIILPPFLYWTLLLCLRQHWRHVSRTVFRAALQLEFGCQTISCVSMACGIRVRPSWACQEKGVCKRHAEAVAWTCQKLRSQLLLPCREKQNPPQRVAHLLRSWPFSDPCTWTEQSSQSSIFQTLPGLLPLTDAAASVLWIVLVFRQAWNPRVIRGYGCHLGLCVRAYSVLL